MIKILMCGPDSECGGVANHTRSLTNELRKTKVRVISYNFSGSNINKIYRRTFGLIFKSLMEKNCDLIHVQASRGVFSFISAISGVIASKLMNVPLIVTYHNSQIKSKILFKIVIQNSAHIILVSNLQKKVVLKTFPDYCDTVSVIPNGFDKELFFQVDTISCREKLKLPIDDKIILGVGNLLEEKGYRILVDAIKIIEDIEIFCIIIGDGPLKKELIDYVELNHLSDRIKFIGSQPHGDISIWMNACDLFVLPSLNEGNPTVMFEALGCGKPFVGTRVGGVPEIIKSEQYGLLVNPANSKDLAEKIRNALNREWNQEAIRQYAEHYTWEQIAKDVNNIYKNILK